MAINGVTSSMFALSLLFYLSLSLLTGEALSTPTVAGGAHPLHDHLTEWKPLPTTDRGSRPRMESWQRSTEEVSTHQLTENFSARASSRGVNLDTSRSQIASNTTATTSMEVNALLAFRNSIPTDPTGVLSNWTTENNSSYCSTWKAVTCGAAGEVIRIDLPDSELNGTITSLIGDLVHLTVLNLTGSSLWGSSPSDLGRCQNLSVLDLSYNSLDGQLPAELFMIPKLEFLWLSNNRISGPLPEVVENGCRSMTNIRIDNTTISGILPSSLSKCRSSKIFILDGQLPKWKHACNIR